MTAVPALIVFLVCASFTWLVFARYLRNRRLSHFYWAISLFLSALGSLAYVFCMWIEPERSLWFTLYYLFGALWMPVIMGLGSLSLVWSKRWVYISSGIVVLTGLFGSVSLLSAPVSKSMLANLDGGAGASVIQPGLWLPCLIVLNSIGALAVILVALWSAVRVVRGRSPVRFMYGNLWLAAGVLVISMAGSGARLGWPAAFWMLMCVGWVVTFIGYLYLSPQPQTVQVSSPATQSLS